MKNVPRASSINSTYSAGDVEYYDQVRVAHKIEEDNAYNCRIDKKVREDIKKKLKQRDRSDRKIVSENLTTLNNKRTLTVVRKHQENGQ